MRSRLTLLPFAVLVACGGGSDTTGPGTGGPGGSSGPVATTSVDMQGSRFAPAAIRVAPSATVTWTNSDGFAHNVIFAGAVGSIPSFTTGSRQLAMPAAPGTYTYSCNLHPGMNGSVQVQ